MSILEISKDLVEERNFQILKDVIKEKLNFDSDKYAENFLKRRILVRQNFTGILDYKDYSNLLKDNEEEQKKLLKNLTIHVTEFFRDKQLWDYCKDTFFPDILNMFKDKNEIIIWSAGCSSGQEAISILITFLEIDPQLNNKIKIICTDISEKILIEAREARYEESSIKGLSSSHFNKYFDKEENYYILKLEYRKNFEFRQHDLLQEKPLKNTNLLFFRNTVIYFSKESKEETYKKFYDEIPTPFFLILGKTETINGDVRNLFKVYNSLERIYTKND
jgi:chemotaxis methyl-accepting protein methylase